MTTTHSPTHMTAPTGVVPDVTDEIEEPAVETETPPHVIEP